MSMGSGCTFVAHARPSSAQDERGVPLSGFAAVALRPPSLQDVGTHLSGQNKQAASHRPPCRVRQGLASKRRARSGSRAGFLIHLRISFSAIRAARSRAAYASGGESSALHARVALRDAAHERNQSRIAVTCAVTCAVAGKRARRPRRCATDGRDTDAAASFRPHVTDTQHFESVSPHDAGAAPRRRNHACATGIECAMTLRSLPRQNSHIEAIQCASKDA